MAIAKRILIAYPVTRDYVKIAPFLEAKPVNQNEHSNYQFENPSRLFLVTLPQRPPHRQVDYLL
jgi:hypothetical protein